MNTNRRTLIVNANASENRKKAMVKYKQVTQSRRTYMHRGEVGGEQTELRRPEEFQSHDQHRHYRVRCQLQQVIHSLVTELK